MKFWLIIRAQLVRSDLLVSRIFAAVLDTGSGAALDKSSNIVQVKSRQCAAEVYGLHVTTPFLLERWTSEVFDVIGLKTERMKRHWPGGFAPK